MEHEEFVVLIRPELISRYPQRFATFDSLSENGKSLLLYLYSQGQSASLSTTDKDNNIMSNEQAYELYAKAADKPHFLEEYIISYDQQMDATGAIIGLANNIGFYLPIEVGFDIPVEFYTKIQEMVLLEPSLQELKLSQEELATMTPTQVAARLSVNKNDLYVEHYLDRQFYVPQILYKNLD